MNDVPVLNDDIPLVFVYDAENEDAVLTVRGLPFGQDPGKILVGGANCAVPDGWHAVARRRLV